MSDLDDAVRDHTRELVWLSGLALLGGILGLSFSLFIGGLCGLVAASAMRQHRLVSVGIATTVTVAALAIHAVTGLTTASTAWRWLELVLCVAVAADLLVATVALVRYRRAHEDSP